MLALVTGGARSGKSRFAERYAAALGNHGTYIATAQIKDEEMRERIAKHRRERDSEGFPWQTLEVPLDLADALSGLYSGAAGRCKDAGPGIVLADCLTLWLSNVLLAGYEDDGEEKQTESTNAAFERVNAEIDRLAAVLAGLPPDAKILLVTNEVGDGIVPEYPLGRLYRDLAGILNQRVAAICQQVFLVTAGIPVELKAAAFRLPVTGLPDGKEGG